VGAATVGWSPTAWRPDHFDVARSLDNLGLALRRLGQLDAARDAHQHALAIREARLGADHPHRAHALSSLGSVAYQLGDLPTAHDYYQRALDIYKARLGGDHPDAASTSPTSPTCSATLATCPPPAPLWHVPRPSSKPGWAPTTPTSPKPARTSTSSWSSCERPPPTPVAPEARCSCLRRGSVPGTRSPP
jgi:hypothetical protein